jgi:hypothetical protein
MASRKLKKTHRPRISHAVRGVADHEPSVHRTSEKTWGESWDKSCTMIHHDPSEASVQTLKHHWTKKKSPTSSASMTSIWIFDQAFCTQTSSTWRLVGTQQRQTQGQQDNRTNLNAFFPEKSHQNPLSWFILTSRGWYSDLNEHFPYFPWRWLLQGSP